MKKSVPKTDITALGLFVTFVIVIVLICKFIMSTTYYHGIGVQFDSSSPLEHQHSTIDQYDADAVIEPMDDPGFYKLVYFHKSEQEVNKLVNQIFHEDYVVDAAYRRIDISEVEHPK